MEIDKGFALGVIACGHSYHRERNVYVLQVQRVNRDLLLICQREFGGKLYRTRSGANVWILRGKALKQFLAEMPLYPGLP